MTDNKNNTKTVASKKSPKGKVPDATSAKSKKPSTRTSKPSTGGALMDDIKNLAVPFAILLAKQGLDQHFEKEKEKSSSSKTVSKPKVASVKRRGTMAGGSGSGECTTGCVSGGAPRHRENNILQQRFDNIAKEIEQFLRKY